MTLFRPLTAAAAACATLLGALPAHAANDFPTVARVLYVHECMRDHPGAHFEMVNKCACALDKLAEQISFDEYETLSTEANATTIGGERGAYLRENEGVQTAVRRYRKLQTEVKKACFVIR
ncbi:hypothetical protein KAK06_17030 [Ideonella sp. 4Y11]|uniref:Uncharacterized protein n=1 Tax=Ideonella aquatica TaxID=2824119 RepID=A0A940YL60_9BURK|nr:hypothetical protein [Ideonella aquatica]MBQ0960662.1 hypothetical protein [Ideonella aquatica]